MKAIEYAINKKLVDFNQNNYDDDNNFFVEKPTEFLEYLTDQKWTVEKVYDYTEQPDEYVVEWWTINDKTGHFARIKNHKRNFNSLQKSLNVTSGRVGSYRIFKIKE